MSEQSPSSHKLTPKTKKLVAAGAAVLAVGGAFGIGRALGGESGPEAPTTPLAYCQYIIDNRGVQATLLNAVPDGGFLLGGCTNRNDSGSVASATFMNIEDPGKLFAIEVLVAPDDSWRDSIGGTLEPLTIEGVPEAYQNLRRPNNVNIDMPVPNSNLFVSLTYMDIDNGEIPPPPQEYQKVATVAQAVATNLF